MSKVSLAVASELTSEELEVDVGVGLKTDERVLHKLEATAYAVIDIIDDYCNAEAELTDRAQFVDRLLEHGVSSDRLQQTGLRENAGSINLLSHEDQLFRVAKLFRTLRKSRIRYFPMWSFDPDTKPRLFVWDNPLALNSLPELAHSVNAQSQFFLRWQKWARWYRLYEHVKPFGLQVSTVEYARVRFAVPFSAALHYSGSDSRNVKYRVDSQNHGYRLCVTPQYVMNPVVFGSNLSRPVEGYLSPGRYRFGGDKGDRVFWDFGVHEVSNGIVSTNLTAF